MKKLRVLLLACLGLLLSLITACNPTQQAPTAPDNGPIGSKDIPFQKDGRLKIMKAGADSTVVADLAIEIAETPEKREQGLMYRRSLPDQSGMLFIFDRDEPQEFWMANTYISLDLIFINSKKEIVSIAKYAQPLSTQGVRSEAPAQYVLEVVGGFADQNGLVEGQKVKISRP